MNTRALSVWTSALIATLALAACGEKAPATSAAPAAAPVAASAAKPADAAAKPEEKKEEHNPLAHEGIPGMTDLFSKKKDDQH